MANKEYMSDELLAAYLDGNTNKEETAQIISALKGDKELREVFDIALSVEDNNYMFEDEVIPMMQMAADSGENICSVLCEAYVLHRRQVIYDKETLLATARENRWLRPEGAPLHAIGQLLILNGLIVTRMYDAILDDIADALACDNDVIVAVDSEKLYLGLLDEEDAPNHAVVVTGIDSETDMVTIYDPQHNRHMSVIGYQFEQAWRESRNYMVRVLRSIDEYIPHPISLDNVKLTEEFTELQEAIAENAHEVWAEARIREGWSYGDVRDDTNKHHPDLIPYSALPDSEKEYDRKMALNTIKLVKKLGFDIVKRDK